MCKHLAFRVQSATGDPVAIEATSLAREGQLTLLGEDGWWLLGGDGCGCAFLGEFGLATTVLARVCDLARRKDVASVEIQWWEAGQSRNSNLEVRYSVEDFRMAAVKGALLENICYRISHDPAKMPAKQLELMD